jgi:hypothetical protein
MARERNMKPNFRASMGHFVCVDGFGPVSADEQKAGLQGHGEAHLLPWKQTTATPGSLAYEVELPITREILRRTHKVKDGEPVVYVDSELVNLLKFDRPVVWAEHATIGAPFLAPGKTVVDLSAGPCRTRPYRPPTGRSPRRLASGVDFAWPFAPAVAGPPIDIRNAPVELDSLDHTACAMDRNRPYAWVTALNLEHRMLLGYVFRHDEYPWLQNWQNYPTNGALSRGLEFGTQPYDVPRRESIAQGSLFGVPTYRWLPAAGKIRARFLMFYVKSLEGFGGVDELVVTPAGLTLSDRRSGRSIAVPAREAEGFLK